MTSVFGSKLQTRGMQIQTSGGTCGRKHLNNNMQHSTEDRSHVRPSVYLPLPHKQLPEHMA